MTPPPDPRPSITTFFGIWGDHLNPDECTRVIGLLPTEVELKGQARPQGRPQVPVTSWTIKIEKLKSHSIDQPLAKLLSIVWPQRSQILRFIALGSVSAVFGTNVTIYEERPEYCLSPTTLRRLAYFKVEYCLDIFDYSNSGE
jgi:hypothetical protein